MTDLQQTVLPWLQAFGIAVSVMLLAVIACAVWGAVKRRGPARKRWLLGVGVAFLVWIGLVAGYYTVLVRVYLPAARPDVANKPGTLTRLGQAAPDFSLKTLEGNPFRLGEQRRQVVLLNFFATWCGPCQEELPHLQDIWTEFGKHDAFRMLVVGREESSEKVAAFGVKHGFTFPMAADPDRSAYGGYASARIPRTYLISREGTILYQCTGYYEAELEKLKRLIRAELNRQPKQTDH
jgi:peroxiredoxin